MAPGKVAPLINKAVIKKYGIVAVTYTTFPEVFMPAVNKANNFLCIWMVSKVKTPL